MKPVDTLALRLSGDIVKRPMTGFGIDEEGDWFAFLGCGHRQHVRHRPPFISRPWVTTAVGRQSRIGHELDCVRCDRLELPDNAVHQQTAAGFTEQDLVVAMRQSRAAGHDSLWVCAVVTRGELRYRAPSLDIDIKLASGNPGIIPPEATHQLDPVGPVSFYLEIYRVPLPEFLSDYVKMIGDDE